MNLISLLSIIMLGFFLGMRHATDPDHVVAITTIVSRYRRVSHAALIGSLWGLGHTLTILAVGGGIILFGWVIPTRIGLSMEFSVALMLILLGILNLTGIMQWITDRLTPRQAASIAVSPDVSSGHRDGKLDKLIGNLGLYQTMRPLVIGLVHGLAGSAAVALLV